MSEREYHQDDVLGHGYCPRCYRAMTLDTSLHGICEVHGRVPGDFTRPLGWVDPDETVEGHEVLQ